MQPTIIGHVGTCAANLGDTCTCGAGLTRTEAEYRRGKAGSAGSFHAVPAPSEGGPVAMVIPFGEYPLSAAPAGDTRVKIPLWALLLVVAACIGAWMLWAMWPPA